MPQQDITTDADESWWLQRMEFGAAIEEATRFCVEDCSAELALAITVDVLESVCAELQPGQMVEALGPDIGDMIERQLAEIVPWLIDLYDALPRREAEAPF